MVRPALTTLNSGCNPMVAHQRSYLRRGGSTARRASHVARGKEILDAGASAPSQTRECVVRHGRPDLPGVARAGLLVLAIQLLGTPAVLAQTTYPNRPITLVIGLAAGSRTTPPLAPSCGARARCSALSS